MGIKSFLFTLAISGLMSGLNAQNFEWAKQFEGINGSAQSQGKAIAVDNSGNIYSTGVLFGSVDFDPGPGSTILTAGIGSVDIYVTKSDSAGALIWAKQFEGNSFNSSEAISVDMNGNVYVTGYFRQTVDFNPAPAQAILNLTSQGNTDIFVTKLDAAGNLVWAKQFAGANFNGAYSIAVDGSGNVFTTGYFRGIVDFNSGSLSFNLAASGSSSDVFIAKLDASGELVWVKQFGGTGSGVGSRLVLDASGSIYTVGNFQNTVDFDPGAGVFDLTSAGLEDIFISKLDEMGNFVWAKQFLGTNSDDVYSIAVANSGNLFTVGRFQGTIDVDPGVNTFNMTSTGNNNTFVAKLNASGDLIWAKQLEGTNIIGRDLVIDDAENSYLTGEFEGTANIDPSGINLTLTSSGGLDFFNAKLNSAGDVVWANGYGSVANETSQSVAVDNLENVWFTGDFGGTVDFDPSGSSYLMTPVGMFEAFIFKISQCGGNSIDITTSLSDLTITANNANATYQWVDCDDNSAPITGATNQSFTATANGNYAVEITENGCTETSDCIAVTTVGMGENEIAANIILYPNPSNDIVTIEGLENFSSVAIYDAFGKLISTYNLDAANTLSVNVNGFEGGMYFVKINNEQTTDTKRLMVTK
jgi:hypothetical protein